MSGAAPVTSSCSQRSVATPRESPAAQYTQALCLPGDEVEDILPVQKKLFYVPAALLAALPHIPRTLLAAEREGYLCAFGNQCVSFSFFFLHALPARTSSAS